MPKFSKRIMTVLLSMALLFSLVSPSSYASLGNSIPLSSPNEVSASSDEISASAGEASTTTSEVSTPAVDANTSTVEVSTPTGNTNTTDTVSQDEIESARLEWTQALAQLEEQRNSNNGRETSNPNELVRVIVKVDKPAAYDISKVGTTTQMLNSKNQVIKGQDAIKNQVKLITGSAIRNSFGYFLNGFSTTVKRSKIDEIKRIPGVEDVEIAKVYKIDMNYAKELTQATQVWEKLNYKGEGMVVAIIDSGIDVNHKDLKITDVSKAKIKEPYDSRCTYKVPYVYNYADRNYDVMDKNPNTNMHGMHVAGIVAANGDVMGVAPEAQLLALKVFTNDPDGAGAFSDDITAAIEDAAMLGADIINMSLGSSAGSVDPNDAEQIAIKRAVEKGVMVVVSAGNSYYSTYPNKKPGMPDTGLVGSPGIAPEALQVASHENTNVTNVALDYKAGDVSGQIAYTTSEVKPEEALKSADGYDVVDLGTIADDNTSSVYDEAKGKIALIQKTGGSFGGKKTNAQNAGAIGVIFYGEDDTLYSTAHKDGVTIPCICIIKSDADKLKGIINSGLKVYFNGNIASTSNPDAGKMSDFSSWGPAPNLDFKPEITGVGGNIWSLANNDKYQNMSGTSMSSPHVAGAQALIIGAKKQQKLSVPSGQFINFVKNISMNTSKIVLDIDHKNVPVSPRKQGAGLIQIKDAIDNNVTVTYEGKAAAALREIGKEKAFALKLNNYGDKAVTYTLENGGILTEIKSNIDEKGNVIDDVHDIYIDGATMKLSQDTVTVNPGTEVTVDVTITLPDNFDTEQFVEGFVKFNSNTEGAASISIPYIGFYGDWSKPLVIDKPGWDPEHVLYGSRLAAPNGIFDRDLGIARDKNDNAYIIPENIAISTTTEDYLRPVSAYLSAVRNAKQVIIQILDSNKNVIRNLGIEDGFTKAIASTGKTPLKRAYSSQWDLKIFNSKTGKYEYVKDGQYYYRIISTPEFPNAKQQYFDMPIKVDSVAPTVEINQLPEIDKVDADYKVTWKASDNLSGLLYEPVAGGRPTGWTMIKVNGSRVSSLLSSTEIIDEGNGVFSYIIPVKKVKANFRKGENIVSVQIQDNAGNITIANAKVVLNSVNTTITPDIVVRGLLNGSYYNNVQDGKITLNGVVSDKVSKLTASVTGADGKLLVDNVDIAIDRMTGNYTVTLPVNVGEANTFTFIAFDANGNKIDSASSPKVLTATFDTTNPELKVDETGIMPTELEDYSGKLITTSSAISIKGFASDKFLNKVVVGVTPDNKNRTEITLIPNENGEFSTDITIPTGLSNLYVKAIDKAGNITEKTYLVVADMQKDQLQYQFNIASNMILTGADVEIHDGMYVIPVVCRLNKDVKQVRIQDKEVPVSNLIAGAYVPLEEGVTKISVFIEDMEGNVAANYSYKLYFDATPSVINLTSTHIQNTNVNENVDYLMNLDQDGTVTLEGNVFDNAFGYSFTINGEAVEAVTSMEPIGPEGTIRTFSKKIAANVGDIIELKAVDLFGYETVKYIKVVDNNKGMEITNKTDVTEFALGSDAKVTVEVKNHLTVDTTASIIVALYDQNERLIGYTCGTQIIATGKSVELQGIITLPTTGEGYKVRAFVWDSIESGKALSDVLEFTVK